MSKKSSSQQSQSTNQTDARQVVDGGSVGNTGSGGAAGGDLAIAGSGNSVVMTDHGLIAGALEYMMARDVAGAEQTDKILNVSGELAKNALEKAGDADTIKTALYVALGGMAVVFLGGKIK